ncbi:MAG TPA: TetR/AcrR family transcriptional regulator [Devosia sp.]|nr:TetR/AcrR family transcriptional regulator [Devosia sp.]
MPYTAEHKQKTRGRIIQAARKLFNLRGFDSVSIDEIMREAGLTHGGFYKHFAAKDELYQEAVLEFICKETPDDWQRRHIDPTQSGPMLARMILDAYLSDEHFTQRDASCPMIALPSDVQRSNPSVQGAFRQVLEMMAGAFEANLESSARPARQRALALTAMAVGAMVLARAVDDPALAKEIRQSARNEAYARPGWGLAEAVPRAAQ